MRTTGFDNVYSLSRSDTSPLKDLMSENFNKGSTLSGTLSEMVPRFFSESD